MFAPLREHPPRQPNRVRRGETTAMLVDWRCCRRQPAEMSEFDASTGLTIRDDLSAAHARAWARIARPGTWWDGAARVAIAAETRQAPRCALCRRRKEALSP